MIGFLTAQGNHIEMQCVYNICCQLPSFYLLLGHDQVHYAVIFGNCANILLKLSTFLAYTRNFLATQKEVVALPLCQRDEKNVK